MGFDFKHKTPKTNTLFNVETKHNHLGGDDIEMGGKFKSKFGSKRNSILSHLCVLFICLFCFFVKTLTVPFSAQM
jgi:hypothetical protein